MPWQIEVTDFEGTPTGWHGVEDFGWWTIEADMRVVGMVDLAAMAEKQR